MDLETIDKIVTISALFIGLVGCLFCLVHHFFIKNR